MMHVLRSLGVLLVGLLFVSGALAQTEPKPSPFGVPLLPGQTAQTAGAKAERSLLGDAWSFVLAQQHRLNRELASAVRQLKAGDTWNATLALGFVGFLYGVLHAAGPGHGKAVISSYVLANERTVRRGILLSFLAAFIQALSAIAIVGVLAIALKATSLEIRAAEAWIETVSWGLVALVGLWLLYRQISQLLRRPAAGTAVAPARVHRHSHEMASVHDHESQPAGCGCGHAHAHADDAGVHHAARDVPPAHAAHGSCCGHAHMPDPSQLAGPLSWRTALAIAVSVGIRPCTGAILILIFALSQGLLGAGIFAAFAMALGTAITVSMLAALAVGSRDLARHLAGGESRLAGAVTTGAGLIGSGLVFLMGASFFVTSLSGGVGGPF